MLTVFTYDGLILLDDGTFVSPAMLSSLKALSLVSSSLLLAKNILKCLNKSLKILG